MGPAHGEERTWSRASVAALALVQVWVLTAAVARLGVSTVEQAVFTAVQGLPAALVVPFELVMPFGTLVGGLLVALLVGLALRSIAYRLTFAVPMAWLAATATKAAVSRGRPADVLELATDAAAGASGPGYPSGHTAVAVAMATALWPDLGGAGRVVVTILAAMVAVGRVVLGVHLPLDLAGGAVIGALAGLGARAVVRRARA